MNTLKEVLFICHGNVGRSQMAEAFYNAYTHGKNAISAGVLDVAAKYQHHPTQEIRQAMDEWGIDISGQEIKQVTPEMLAQARLIVILCDPELCPEIVQSGLNVLVKQVEDPHQKSAQVIKQVSQEVRNIVLTLIADRISDQKPTVED